MTYKNVIYGVSNHNCNNRKLFDFIESNQNTEATLLQFFKRIEDGKEEEFAGIPVQVLLDGNIDVTSLMLVQELWDKNEHAKASGVEAKIYFL